jgi:hypothetical protein
MAQKNKRIKKGTKQVEYLSYINGFYSHVAGGVRIVGDVYELTIKTNVDNVIIDKVWFGATPVPCDVYSMETNYRVDTASKKGTYLVKANKNLYRNFYYQIDSSEAAQSFRPPFIFKGDAIVMYTYKGKRYYKSVSGVEQHEAKKYR